MTGWCTSMPASLWKLFVRVSFAVSVFHAKDNVVSAAATVQGIYPTVIAATSSRDVTVTGIDFGRHLLTCKLSSLGTVFAATLITEEQVICHFTGVAAGTYTVQIVNDVTVVPGGPSLVVMGKWSACLSYAVFV